MQLCKTVVLAILLGLSQAASAEIIVRDRHIMILYSGVDAVWGNYIFMVSNQGEEAAHLEMDLLLPKETVDWQAQDGLAPNDIILAEGGGLQLSKMLTPGDHLLSMGFKVPASGGQARLSISPPFDISQIGLFIGDKDMELVAEGVTVQRNVPFSGRTYDTYTVETLAAGSTLQATISGVPEGRGRFWILGAVAGMALVGIGGFLSYKTLPQTGSERAEAEVVN